MTASKSISLFERRGSAIIRDFLICIFGAILYAFMMNEFLMPFKFISGSVTGIAQLLAFVSGSLVPAHIQPNLTGIYLLLLNIPLFILATKLSNRLFIYKTIVTVIFQTLAFSIIPVPNTPPVQDPLTACALVGIIGGIGIGLTLKSGGCTGGLDILGLYLATKRGNFSVGRIYIVVSILIYAATFIRFDLETTIYSIIYTFISSFVMDKVHFQNIKVVAWIITDHEEIQDFIIHQLNRTATKWVGQGIYSGSQKNIYMTTVSKFDVMRLKRQIQRYDPNAFVIISDSADVVGKFQMRID